MTSLTRSSHRLLFIVLLLLFMASSPASRSQTTLTKSEPTNHTAQAEIRNLEAGRSVAREIRRGESHSYEVELETGQYVSGVVIQRDVDIVITIRSPEGILLIYFDSETGVYGEETFDIIAEKPGKYRVNIATSSMLGAVGTYTIESNKVRAAIEDDKILQQASKLEKEAQGLSRGARYDEALTQAKKVLEIREKIRGKDHAEVGKSLITLARLYFDKGDYPKAEPLLQRALMIYEKTLGATHPEIANLLRHLATLYQSKGDYSAAEPLLIRALAICERTFGSEHPEVADALNQLALLYYDKRDYTKAEPLYQRALAIYEIYTKALGTDHARLATLLHNMAALYRRKGDYTKAEALLVRALAIREKGVGAEHPIVANSLSQLATLYRSKGNYAAAEPLLIRALAIYEKTFGVEHPDIASALNHLARLYQARDDVANALRYKMRGNEAQEGDLIRNLTAGSERQKLLYLNQSSGQYNETISLHVTAAPDNPEALRLASTAVLRYKGRALDAMNDAVAVLRRRALAADQKLFDQLASLRTELAVLTLRGPVKESSEKYRANLQALEAKVENLEAQISQRSIEFRTQLTPINLQNVQQAISANAALVEFAAFRPINSKEPDDKQSTGKPRYVAYLLRHEGEPTFVELGDATLIDAIIREYRQKIDAFRRARQTRNSKEIGANPAALHDLGRRLDQLVMEPVRRLLGTTRRVLLSPDGNLNLIPFAALVDERGDYLVKNYSFTYLTSGRDLLRLQTRVPGKAAKLVLANPDFGKAATEGRGAFTNAGSQTKGMLDEYVFLPLTATRREAADLQRLFPEAKVMTAAKATESALKAADRPTILHIATHGFFLKDEQELVTDTSGEQTRLAVRRRKSSATQHDENTPLINPLMRSGLALAGANERNGGKGEDGILTASEATTLDLWGTKLVVLSACDTGVGKVVSGDGVYGLRRALVLAGSEAQMMSLWTVSDTGTRELMIEYYRRLKAGEGRSEALRQTQLQLLENPQRQHPFYWASFIQSGEWANLDGNRGEK